MQIVHLYTPDHDKETKTVGIIVVLENERITGTICAGVCDTCAIALRNIIYKTLCDDYKIKEVKVESGEDPEKSICHPT